MGKYEYHKTHEVWKQGWLRDKEFCHNRYHNHYNPVIDNIVRDLNRGENRIIIVVGTPRSGKSGFSLLLQSFFNWCYFGRPEYAPSDTNTQPINDVFWGLDEFIEATKNPENTNKFITMEEQGVENFKFDFWNRDSQSADKLQQIFGIDNTNLIINLPYIFDLNKGTRLKGHYLIRAFRRASARVDVILCYKWMDLTTAKASYRPTRTVWKKIPFIANVYPDLWDLYLRMKIEYNTKKKVELTAVKANKKRINTW